MCHAQVLSVYVIVITEFTINSDALAIVIDDYQLSFET